MSARAVESVAGLETARRGGRILILDAQALLGEALAHFLARLGSTTRVAARASLAHTTSELTMFEPDVVVIEVEASLASDVTDHISVAAEIARVLTLGPEPDDLEFAAWLEAGATGRIDIAHGIGHFTQVIDDVLHGRRILDLATEQRLRSLGRSRVGQSGREIAVFDNLSDREAAVLQGMLDGFTANEIAEASFVTVATVRSQIQAVLRKLRVNSQLAAVAVAHRHNWSISTGQEAVNPIRAEVTVPNRFQRQRAPLTLG